MLKKRLLFQQVSLKKRDKELVLVLATFMQATAARKEVVKNIETGETNKNGKNKKKDENLETNLA